MRLVSREIVHANDVTPEFTVYLILFLTPYLWMTPFSVKLNTVICYGYKTLQINKFIAFIIYTKFLFFTRMKNNFVLLL